MRFPQALYFPRLLLRRFSGKSPFRGTLPQKGTRNSHTKLIRQATIICAERGLLLLRVRDEIRMTICAYQSLYESSGFEKAFVDIDVEQEGTFGWLLAMQ